MSGKIKVGLLVLLLCPVVSYLTAAEGMDPVNKLEVQIVVDGKLKTLADLDREAAMRIRASDESFKREEQSLVVRVNPEKDLLLTFYYHTRLGKRGWTISFWKNGEFGSPKSAIAGPAFTPQGK